MLDGKTIIITGAGGGQGEATARLFAESGASVILTDIDEARVKDVAASLGSSATGCQHDISDEAGWQDVVEAAGKAFGDIDGLINNAGILATGALEETSAADMERLFQINVLGAFLGMKAVSPNMPEGSSIVNIASAAGLSGKPTCWPTAPANGRYAASRARLRLIWHRAKSASTRSVPGSSTHR